MAATAFEDFVMTGGKHMKIRFMERATGGPITARRLRCAYGRAPALKVICI